MTIALMTGAHVRWQVLWIVKKKGKKPYIVERDFDNDLTAAIELYTRAKAAGGKFVTLRCCNAAFPPPRKFAKKMGAINDKGYTWCPYCREFRVFRRQDGFRFEGIYVEEPDYYCPLCSISTKNHHVRRYNPRLRIVIKRTRINRGSKTTRRNKRRS